MLPPDVTTRQDWSKIAAALVGETKSAPKFWMVPQLVARRFNGCANQLFHAIHRGDVPGLRAEPARAAAFVRGGFSYEAEPCDRCGTTTRRVGYGTCTRCHEDDEEAAFAAARKRLLTS